MSNIFMTSRSDAEINHFYPTPPAGTEALLKVEKFEGAIWEPSCGEGHMSDVLGRAGYNVVSTDLIDRGYGLGGRDFLSEQHLLAPNVVTNPPFKFGQQFARHAFDLGAVKTALLCRLMWLETEKRRDLFKECGLARVHVFAKRLGMAKAGLADKGGMVPYAWFVFERGYTGAPTLGWV